MILKIDNPIPNSTYLEIQNYLDSILDSTDQNNKTEDKDNNKKDKDNNRKIKTIIRRTKTIIRRIRTIMVQNK